ncbi:MAG: hypothetical protein LBS57_07140 [Treponema sp.]|nr:hypothetical protein [Treponema sp.]
MILTSLLVFAACEQPIPEVEEVTRQIQVSGIPEKVNANTGTAAPFKIFTQISEGTGIEAGYVAKGEVLIDGRKTVVMDLFDPWGQSWAEEGSYNIAVVISPAVVTSAADIAVHAAMPKLSSRVEGFVWGDMLDLRVLSMTRQIQDVYEGIVCALEETDISHPVRWATADEKTVFLVSEDGASLDGAAFSFNLSKKFDLTALFLVTGTLETSGTDEYKLKGLATANTAEASRISGMNDKVVTIAYNNVEKTEFTLSSTDAAVEVLFGDTYTKE